MFGYISLHSAILVSNYSFIVLVNILLFQNYSNQIGNLLFLKLCQHNSSGLTTEYYGYLMAEQSHPSHRRSVFSCVDKLLTSVIGSKHNHQGFSFCPVEGICGSLPCPPYEETKELTCAVCTK